MKLGSFTGVFCAIMAPYVDTRLVESNGN